MEFVRVREPRTRADRDAEGISIAVPRRRPLWRLLGLLGRETIRLTQRALVYERCLGPVARRRAFDRSHVEDLRVSAESVSMCDPCAGFRMYGIGAGTVAFDYGDRTVRVADTEEAEAKRIVEALRREGL